jgi:alcohol dehydrogenase
LIDLSTDSIANYSDLVYPVDAYRRLLDLVRAGLLDIDAIRPHTFPLNALPEAMEAAATVGSLN